MPGKLLAFAALTLALAAPGAYADMLQATRPGVMCTSPDALAKLTLPDGSSRTTAAHVSPATQAIAQAGGCTDFGAGHVVILLTARKNTDIVRGDTMSGDGVLGNFVVPSIDFGPYTPPHGPFNDTIRAQCPARLEEIEVLGPASYDFVNSLPKQTQAQIDHEVDAECGDGGSVRCISNAQAVALGRHHLEQRWAEFICRHP